MLSRDALPMDIGAKYVDGNSCLLQKAPQVSGRKTHHIHQFEKVYRLRAIITIVKADYCLMSQLLLNILSNVTLPPYRSFFVLFKHTFVTHLTKISRFSISVTPPPKILNVHLLAIFYSPPKIEISRKFYWRPWLCLTQWRIILTQMVKKATNSAFSHSRIIP